MSDRPERERRLTAAEAAALDGLPLPVDLRRIRLHRGAGGRGHRMLRTLVLGCTGGRAIALGNHVFLPDACCRSLPVLAHEVTHCAQYQAWGPVRYYLRGVRDRLRELRHRGGGGPRPDDNTAEAAPPNQADNQEPHGEIVEDWIRGSARAAALVTAPAGDPPTARTRSRRDQRSSP